MSKNDKKNKFSGLGSKFPKKGPNALWLLMAFLAAGILYLFWYNSVNRDIESITYTKLLVHIESDQIKSMHVQDQYVRGTYKNGKMFTTYIAPTEKFWELVKQRNVDVEIFPQEKQSWGTYFLISFLPFLLILLFFYFKQGQGGGNGGKIFSVGKSKAKFFSPNTVQVTFKDVAGVHEAKEDLKD